MCAVYTSFFIRNQLTSNLVLDILTFKKHLGLQGKSEETLDKWHIKIGSWFHVKLYQNNVNMTLP